MPGKAMGFPFRLVYATLCLTALLIFAVYLRGAQNRTFYELRVCTAEATRLKQQLWRNQLRLESLINPAAISERLAEAPGD